jgi:hypothetical protein
LQDRSGRTLLASALAGLLCAAAHARADGEWLEISTPSEGETVRAASGIVALRGRVGSGAERSGAEESGLVEGAAWRAYDVVLALDQSQSTLLPMGVDLDGDGVLGTFTLPGKGDGVCGRRTKYATASEFRCRPFRTWTTDFDDVVLQAERRLAGGMLLRLEAQGARVALVTFTGKVRVETELGPPAQALAALAALPIREDGSGSDLSLAVKHGIQLLGAPRDPAHPAAVLLVTDGLPSSPGNERTAERAARRAAEAARDAGVALYVFQIRSEEEDADTVLLAEMAEMTGGRRIYVDAPERLSFALPSRNSGSVESVEIHNRTLDLPARAPRLYPGGTFDAYVPLADGANALEIRARLPGGVALELHRTVYFEKSSAPSEQARLQLLLEDLRKRTLETEYAPRPGEVDPERRSLRMRTERDGEIIEGTPVEPAEEAPALKPEP